MKRFLRSFSVIVILFFSCLAQGQQTPNLEVGLKPYGSYQGGNIDTIGLSNGNLSLYQVLRHIPQRGGKLDLDYLFRYNNKTFDINQNCNPTDGCHPYWEVKGGLGGVDWVAMGVEVTQSLVVTRNVQALVTNSDCLQGAFSCEYEYANSVALWDGGAHSMGTLATGPLSANQAAPSRSLDGSGLYWMADGTVILPNGVRQYPVWETALSGTYLKDPNGNQISWTDYSSSDPTQNHQSLTDTLGRTLPGLVAALEDPSGPGGYSALPATSDFTGCTGPHAIQSARLMNFPASGAGASGTPIPVVIKLCFVQIPLQTNFQCCGSAAEIVGTPWFLQSIVLPDQTAWTFEYNSRAPSDPANVNYGDLTKVTFPTGGTISYTWQNVTPCNNSTIETTPISRAVSTRTINANDGTGDHTWTYQYAIGGYIDPITTTVTDPQLLQTVHTFTAVAQRCGYYETQTKNLDSSGAVIKTMTTHYLASVGFGADGGSYNVFPDSVTTTWPTGQVSENDKTYLGVNTSGETFSFEFYGPHSAAVGNPVDEYDYDYGAGSRGALLRRAHADYVKFDFNIELPTDQIIYDGGGNRVAETDYSYDEAAYLTSSGLGLPPPGVRGNQTSVRRWLNTNNSFISSHTNWYDTGVPYQTIDPLGNATTFSYDSVYAGAFLTRTCNAKNQCVSGTYDINTGLTKTVTNANATTQASGNTPGDAGHTSTFYYDNMLRVTSANFPDGGQTTFNYPNPTTAEQITKINASLNDDVLAYFDGLGRPNRSKHITPSGSVFADTGYDALGRVATATNPYFNTSDPTYGVTQTQYDALGRAKQVTKQDGSVSSVSYAGNCATATDEAGKRRKSCSDALGRLTNVWEDPSGLNYETDYQYDTLGNMLRVDQKGSAATDSTQWRTRLFTYNSLSQLLTANNPESGTVSYTYDANGNVLSKTDARGITTSFTYDALNRLTQKSYSDGKTSATHFLYDVAPSWGVPITNVIGRLSEVYVDTCPAANGSKAGGNMIFSYDAMGRVILNNQSRPSNCGNGAWTVSATYDLAGNLASIIYPSGRVMTYQHNAANDLNSVQFTQYNGVALAGGAYTYWNVADANFYPNGTPKLASLGNGVSESTLLSKRLQLQEESVSNGALGSFADHAYSYGAQNNGNVLSVADQLNASRTQTFTYDALNRLATANESGGRWGLGFAYDAWGNRLQQNVTAGAAGQSNVVADTRNRIQGAAYDPAGNMLNDGFHQYLYDAESRITQVDNGIANYSYDGDGNRVRKDSADGGTEYLYFGGNVIAERNAANGDWSDYIYANGKRIAKADNFENVVHLHGTRSGSAYQDAVFDMNSLLSQAGLANYAIQSGDHLVYRQLSSTPGGTLGFYFAEGGCTGCNNDALTDSDGCIQYWDTCGGTSWHWRKFDLTQIAGKHISAVRMVATTLTPAGNWDYSFADITVLGADGTVHPLYNGETTISLVQSTTGMSNVGYEVVHNANLTTPKQTTAYYHGDQIGSSRLLSAGGGWPVWQGTFLPFGDEYNPQITTNHYKYTGKERDAETGLDYFGARYYSNGLGRFIQPDPLLNSGRPWDPQTWNRYPYAHNNPLNYVDPSGLYDWQANAGGGATDDELRKKSQDKDLSKKERNAAKDALKFRDNFRNALAAATAAATGTGDQGALAAYGAEGDHNGVNVGTEAGHGGGTIVKGDDSINVNFGKDVSGNELAVVVAHEGQHVEDGQQWIAAGHPLGTMFDMNQYERETRAWGVSARIAQALGMSHYGPHGAGSNYYVWNSSWHNADRVTTAIGNIVRDLYHETPGDTDRYSKETPDRVPKYGLGCDCH